jgi:hypothetical protein
VYAGKRSLGVKGTCKRLARGSSVVVNALNTTRSWWSSGSPLRWPLSGISVVEPLWQAPFASNCLLQPYSRKHDTFDRETRLLSN